MKLFLPLFLSLIACISGQVHYLKLYKDSPQDHKCTILEKSFLPIYRGLQTGDYDGVKIDFIPAVRLPEENADDKRPVAHQPEIIEIHAENKDLLESHLANYCATTVLSRATSEHNHRRSVSHGKNVPEVRKIVDSGDPQNRIDVVFMGDGYTRDEREKFFMDIDRFVQEMFEGVTFRSYLPLFNIWAIYVESQESGIGYDGPKNTPFKLYRERGQLRAVFTANAKFAREVCKLTGPHACDYPSLMGNDEYYGGLGGEFVIFTSSNSTGKIVLRHEMGHNFLVAGEEYDNGYSYFGVNAAKSVDNLRWSHWLSGPKAKEERSMYRILAYPWQDLHERPYNYTFVSDGKYDRWEMTVSVTAAEEDSIEFLLDGEVLPWKPTGSKDREFYIWSGDQGFSRGLHNFAIRAKTRSAESPEVPTMICSIALHEFGNEDEYHKDNNYVSAYPTWNYWRRKSFRPTNAGCLMRNMTHERFCPVCQEGMWINFLSKLTLIDEVIVPDAAEADGSKLIFVKTLQLGQFRPAHKRIAGEFMEIKWFKNDKEQKELQNLVYVRASPGTWTVKVRFETPEVRKDQYGFLNSSQRFIVPAPK